jgi:chromosome segregation ATPase
MLEIWIVIGPILAIIISTAITLIQIRKQTQKDERHDEDAARDDARRLVQIKLDIEKNIWEHASGEIVRLHEDLERERVQRQTLGEQVMQLSVDLKTERIKRRSVEHELHEMKQERQGLLDENNLLKNRVADLERRMDTGPLGT